MQQQVLLAFASERCSLEVGQLPKHWLAAHSQLLEFMLGQGCTLFLTRLLTVPCQSWVSDLQCTNTANICGSSALPGVKLSDNVGVSSVHNQAVTLYFLQ